MAEAAPILTALADIPDFGPFYVARGHLLQLTEGVDPEPDLRRAVQLDASDRTIRVHLIRHLQAGARWGEALVESAAGRRLFPGDFNLDLLHVASLVRLDRALEAIQFATEIDVDGHNVYVLGRFGQLFCLELRTGKRKWAWDWRRKLQGTTLPTWSYSSSPYVKGGHLFVEPGGKGTSVVCLDKNSGKVLPPAITRSNVSVELGFGGDSRPHFVHYAVYVHEMVNIRHKVGNAKFLERPFFQHAPSALRRLKRELPVSFKREIRHGR